MVSNENNPMVALEKNMPLKKREVLISIHSRSGLNLTNTGSRNILSVVICA